MKVLIYGGGAREHALVWKIKQSPLLDKLYLCNPNDGFAEEAEVLEAENFEGLAEISKEKNIDLLVVGPEDPLVNGIVDEFRKKGIPVIGADKKWAMLEGSKSFAKEFMRRNDISTAKYEVISNKSEIVGALKKFTMPVVFKADGLAAGKGVSIVNSFEEAEKILNEYLEGKFSKASQKVVVEEFLEGAEFSLISLWDGKTLLPFIPARDYKRLEENDKGPNTGGMGSYCPVSLSLKEYEEIEKYCENLQTALIRENADFTGVIYSGLIMTEEGIKVLEYNMRFGDPETQPLLMHLDSDLLDIFNKTVDKELDKTALKWKQGQSFCVTIATEGYPESPKKGGEIKNIENIVKNHGVTVFFAGIKKQGNNLVANGGRVLSICQTGPTAQKYIYDAVSELDFCDKVYRKDIGEINLSKEVCQKNEGCCNNCGV